MNANELLFWMSAKAFGSWPQFRSAVARLCVSDQSASDGGPRHVESPLAKVSPHQLYRLNLQRVGHAEFFTRRTEHDWRVAPPTLAVTFLEGAVRAVVSGARSTELLRRIFSWSEIRPERSQSAGSPDVIRLSAASARPIQDFANRNGFAVQMDAAHAILGALPAISDSSVLQPTDLPFGDGWHIERFSVAELRWLAASHRDALNTSSGLFRFSLGHQRKTLFCASSHAFHVSAQVGKYLALLQRRRRRILRHDARGARLIIPASCRPPFLIERALVACSGFLPVFCRESGDLHYRDIPPSVARLAAALLRQDIR